MKTIGSVAVGLHELLLLLTRWEVALEIFPAYQPYHPARKESAPEKGGGLGAEKRIRAVLSRRHAAQVPIQFVKVCGGATRTGFHVGTPEDGKSLVRENPERAARARRKTVAVRTMRTFLHPDGPKR